ncbi:PAS domain-containing sensor histidine kinase [Halobacterium sp. KA-6]|uniref:PAS domain-containing sensor histidine kinase n=1 Tax=Halobacterium sp. KA-6 TaxID=2896368 RepID=UPI001E47872D|nr:PAS domain S-box protein [Halobacterium sp. KA-6]MCD2205055.1 PAS domain S-box protein [Halobacterium sp. KA-6]
MGSSGSTPHIPPEDVEGVFARLDEATTPLSTREIAARLDCSTNAAERTLRDLADRGSIQTKQVADSTRIWWQSHEQQSPRNRTDTPEFSAFVSAVQDYAIFMLDPDGTVASWNTGAEQIKGYRDDEIIGEHFSTFYTPADVDDGVPGENLEAARTAGRVEDEGWRVRKDGSRFWANVIITAVRDDDGELQGFTKVTRDMTERREYEQQLRRERDQTQQLLRTAPIAISVKDADGETIIANQRAQDALGLSKEEILNSPENADEWAVYDANGRQLPSDEMPSARVLQTGEPVFDEEVRIDSPAGDRMQFQINAAPIRDSDGSVERVITAGKDITELKKRERQLEQRKTALETELSEILGRISDAFYALDDEWRFTHLNDQAADIMQHSREELLEEVIWDVFPDSAGVYREHFERAMRTQEPVTFEVHVGGLDSWLEFNVHPSETGVSVYFRDVTDRKTREQTLSKYRTIVETVQDGIYVKDEDGTFTMVNDAYAELTGYEREELVGAHASLVVDEATIDRATQQKATASDVGDATVEAPIETADGERIPTEASFATIETEDGETEQVGVVRDISDRKEYERKLETSNERLEQFAYAASHDLQEPLRMVSSYLQLIEDRYGDELDEDGQEFINFAVDGADRMRAMIDGLLEYSRIETQGNPFDTVDLDSILASVREDLQLQITESNASITAEPLPRVNGDADQLRQVFQNLVENAIEYSGDEPPEITISAERADDKWRVDVSDNGIGLDAEDSDRIFEVFERLHSRDEHPGTGIGLALCQRVIERHDGEIWVESTPGEGATFSFTLPATNPIAPNR